MEECYDFAILLQKRHLHNSASIKSSANLIAAGAWLGILTDNASWDLQYMKTNIHVDKKLR